VSETIVASVAGAILGGVVGAASTLAVEKYRSRLENKARYNQSQFDIYKSLWGSLYDLKVTADKLWKVANVDNLERFAEQLQKTEEVTNGNAPLIEEEHMKELRSLMETFWKFDFGKEELIQLRERPHGYDRIRANLIETVIRQNGKVKDRYNELVDRLEVSFRKQLRTP
jgi:hypothetical protein